MTNEQLEKRLNYFESLVNEKLDKIEDILESLKEKVSEADDDVIGSYDLECAVGDLEYHIENAVDQLRDELTQKIDDEVARLQEGIDTIGDRS